MSVSKPKAPVIIIIAIIGFLLLMAVAFIVFVLFALRGGPTADQSQFTQTVPATITDAQDYYSKGTGTAPDYRFDYEYEAQGNRYAGRVNVLDSTMSEDGPLSVCVDPTDPARHVALVKEGRQCGDKYLGSSTSTADKINGSP